MTAFDLAGWATVFGVLCSGVEVPLAGEAVPAGGEKRRLNQFME